MSVDALRDLFGTNQQDFAKPDGGRNFLAWILGYGLILSEGAMHARQRKQLTKKDLCTLVRNISVNQFKI